MKPHPLVSVRTLTYNHETYIAQCLEGILMQQTTFPFEIVVGEDCSTDRTREIVLAYEQAHPDKIRVITSENNVGAAQNSRRVQEACRGKYIAYCEGDDYWIDPHKLQKQVDFLEAHPDVSMCFHNLFVLKEQDYSVRLYFASARKELSTFEDACEYNVQLASMMIRAEVIASLPEWRLTIWCPDIVLRLWCAHRGKLGYLDEIMAVYRRHSGGMIMTMGPLLEKRYAQEMYMFRELDKDTGYEHTAALQAMAQRAKNRFRREQIGWVYFLLHPGDLIRKIKMYNRLAAKQFAMYR